MGTVFGNINPRVLLSFFFTISLKISPNNIDLNISPRLDIELSRLSSITPLFKPKREVLSRDLYK